MGSQQVRANPALEVDQMGESFSCSGMEAVCLPYLVENRRDGKKARQKVIKYLGAEPPTKEQVETMGRGR